jgi:NDP-sugar pyrophosphorylase family protein
MTANQINTAMIFAAGLGTRLKPWTDLHPKALAVVNGKPLLQRNIEYLRRFGIDRLVINVHHFADQVIAFLEDHNHFGCHITVSCEKEQPLETGGGLKFAAPYLKDAENFFVINTDILTDLNLYAMAAFHRELQPTATIAVSDRDSSRAFLFDQGDHLCGWRNNKSGEERISVPNPDLVARAFSGIHLIHHSFFDLLTEEGRFSMVDVYLRLCTRHSIMGYDHSGGILVDVGKPESIALAEKYFL